MSLIHSQEVHCLCVTSLSRQELVTETIQNGSSHNVMEKDIHNTTWLWIQCNINKIYCKSETQPPNIPLLQNGQCISATYHPCSPQSVHWGWMGYALHLQDAEQAMVSSWIASSSQTFKGCSTFFLCSVTPFCLFSIRDIIKLNDKWQSSCKTARTLRTGTVSSCPACIPRVWGNPSPNQAQSTELMSKDRRKLMENKSTT